MFGFFLSISFGSQTLGIVGWSVFGLFFCELKHATEGLESMWSVVWDSPCLGVFFPLFSLFGCFCC